MYSCRESEQPLETGAIVQRQPNFEEHLSTLRLELEQGLQEVRWWMKDVQCKMTSLEDSQSSQGAILQDVHSLLRSIFQPSFPRKEDAPAESFVPLEDPPLLCFPSQPGQLCQDEVVPVPICARRDSSDSSGRSTESTGRKVKDSKHRRKTNRTNPPKAKGRVSHASTLDELEAQTAKDLLVRKQSSHTLQSIQEAKEASLDESDHFEEDEYTRASSAVSKSRTNSKSKRVGANKTSGSDKNAILGKCQRMSLDELRENHDAAMCVNQSYSNKTAQERESTQVSRTSSSMPPAAKLWLQLLCILPLQYRWLGHFWTLCVFLILLAPTTLLAWLLVEDVHTIMTSTVLCYLVGVIAATWSLRRANIQELLGSSEGSMEQYAFVCGFSQDWRKVSRRRFEEVLAFLFLILGCRWLVHLSEVQHSFEPSLTFSIMAVGFAAVAYAQLHMVAGLELAIDSFSINFFRDMDCGRALEEWNVLQATLRQISTKLSGSMLVLGISCGASMLFLVEIAFLQSDENRFIPEDLNGGFPLLLFTAWVFPPVLLFLYVLMRAAGVTEKASRVAPLVNSWNLEATNADDADDADASSSPDWMDLGRQYIVQYIKQSETGFYMHGVRLHGFQVTKLGYYFGAFVFAIISKIIG